MKINVKNQGTKLFNKYRKFLKTFFSKLLVSFSVKDLTATYQTQKHSFLKCLIDVKGYRLQPFFNRLYQGDRGL